MMLVKNTLLGIISHVDMDAEDQIWVVLSWMPELKIGGVYIPPDYSLYFQDVQYGVLTQRTVDDGSIIVMGDFNARVGTLVFKDDRDNCYKYRGIKDNGTNNHGRTLSNICHNNMMVVANHLHHRGRQLGGDLSFRRRDTWVSEIDLCLSKQQCVDLIKTVETRQDIHGSDHVPLCITLETDSDKTVSPSQLLQRGTLLDLSHFEFTKRHKLQKSVCYKDLDIDGLVNALQDVTPPSMGVEDEGMGVDAAISEGCRVIMDTATRFTRRRQTAGHSWDEANPRWKRILDSNDSKLI